jgi:hypothetical protein
MRMNQEIESFLPLNYFDFYTEYTQFDCKVTGKSVLNLFVLKKRSLFFNYELLLAVVIT